MIDHPLLSIITPVFNGEKFIQDCLEAVLNQTCPYAEHVIVDGHSTDGTVAVIRDFASRHTHIRWISEKDNGQSDALNKGVAMARGNILGMLNVDDFYEPGVFNRVVEIFKNLPIPSFLVGNCNVWDNEGRLLYVNKPSRLGITDLLLGGIFPHPVNPSAYFYHKSLHEIIGPYDRDMQIGQDLPFLLSAVQAAHVKYMDELWGNWRKLEGTLTVKEQKDDTAKRRNQLIVESYLRNLSLKKRIVVMLKKSLCICKSKIRKIF